MLDSGPSRDVALWLFREFRTSPNFGEERQLGQLRRQVPLGLRGNDETCLRNVLSACARRVQRHRRQAAHIFSEHIFSNGHCNLRFVLCDLVSTGIGGSSRGDFAQVKRVSYCRVPRSIKHPGRLRDVPPYTSSP